MKKSLFILAAAALMASCGNDSVRNDIVENEVPIGFVPTFMEKSTKANAGEMIIDRSDANNIINTFNVDGNTFEVWGWKTNTDGTSKVFDNQTVTYNSSNTTQTTKWGYTPLKYWDRSASYKFYAVAPHGVFTLNEDNTTEANRKFSASGVPTVQTLQNSDASSTANLIKLATAESSDPGTASTAIDYLVAAKVECAAGKANQSNNTPRYDSTDSDVEFTFSHILSKLTVKVLTTDDFAGSGKPDIKLDELTMSINGVSRNYAQTTAGITTPAVAGASNYDVWTNAITDSVKVTCFHADNSSLNSFGIDSLLLTDAGQQVASYFVTPTPTTSGEASVRVIAKYTVYYSDGVVDHCISPETKVESLTSFIQNNSYTLNIKIAPEAILFDVNVVNGFTPEDAIEQEVE